ncbi:hypothetical protein XENORESO_015069 [Xenotaenia resolanae]|uniref:Uncharacterized protein n=1 Tax=Xenotaenia resolanae TaxID=208358 RepID=A0ABV0WUN3_9TELE
MQQAASRLGRPETQILSLGITLASNQNTQVGVQVHWLELNGSGQLLYRGNSRTVCQQENSTEFLLPSFSGHAVKHLKLHTFVIHIVESQHCMVLLFSLTCFQSFFHP